MNGNIINRILYIIILSAVYAYLNGVQTVHAMYVCIYKYKKTYKNTEMVDLVLGTFHHTVPITLQSEQLF